MTAQEDRDLLRQRQRELLAKEEAERRERQEKGIVEPVFDLSDQKVLDVLVKLGTLAKAASRTKVALKAHNDAGELTTLEERLAHEEIYLAALLTQRLNSELERER